MAVAFGNTWMEERRAFLLLIKDSEEEKNIKSKISRGSFPVTYLTVPLFPKNFIY